MPKKKNSGKSEFVEIKGQPGLYVYTNLSRDSKVAERVRESDSSIIIELEQRPSKKTEG